MKHRTEDSLHCKLIYLIRLRREGMMILLNQWTNNGVIADKRNDFLAIFSRLQTWVNGREAQFY